MLLLSIHISCVLIDKSHNSIYVELLLLFDIRLALLIVGDIEVVLNRWHLGLRIHLGSVGLSLTLVPYLIVYVGKLSGDLFVVNQQGYLTFTVS
jgi:hypothetical protein